MKPTQETGANKVRTRHLVFGQNLASDSLLLQQVDLHGSTAEPGRPVVGVDEDRVLPFRIPGDSDPRERAGVVP
jgi:hypothetical protein